MLSFETMILEPVDGQLDTEAVEAWLISAAFISKVGDGKWRIHETAVLAATDGKDGSVDFPIGVTMLVEPERLSLVSHAGSMSRTREFVDWLAGQRTLRVNVDRVGFVTLTSVPELFGGASVERDLDHGVERALDFDFFADIESGAITRWGGDGHQLQVHSSGRLRFHASDRVLLARLSAEMTTAWNAAVELVDESDPDVPEKPAQATAIIVEVETNDEDDWILVTIDRRHPPPSMRALAEIAERWFEALIEWNGIDGIDGLADIRHA